MNGIPVIKRYARALYEAGKDAGELDSIRGDIAFIDRLMHEGPEIKRFCLESHNNRTKEFDFIRTAFSPYISPFTARMIEALCENNRLSAVPYIPAAFREQEDAAKGIEAVEIESANELTDESLSQIESRMQQRLGVKIRTKVRINPVLIGGVRITWSNRTIDMSLRGRLNAMKKLLK